MEEEQLRAGGGPFDMRGMEIGKVVVEVGVSGFEKGEGDERIERKVNGEINI